MTWYMGKDYMKDHLLSYVRYQVSQGYGLSDLEQVLIRYGYHEDLVKEVMARARELGLEPVQKKKKAKKEMDSDLYYYLQNLLIDYIKRELSQGYSKYVIKRALLNYGHHEELVEKAMKAVESGRIQSFAPRVWLKFSASLMYWLSIMATFAVVFYLAYVTDSGIFIVFASFVPTFAALSITSIAFGRLRSYKHTLYLPIVSVLSAVLIYIGLLQGMAQLRNLGEPNTVLVMNIVLAFVLGSIIAFFSRLTSKKIRLPDEVGGREIEIKEVKDPHEEATDHVHDHHNHRKKVDESLTPGVVSLDDLSDKAEFQAHAGKHGRKQYHKGNVEKLRIRDLE